MVDELRSDSYIRSLGGVSMAPSQCCVWMVLEWMYDSYVGICDMVYRNWLSRRVAPSVMEAFVWGAR